MQADPTIGSWSESTLAKYIRDSVALLTPAHIPGLTVDDLVIPGSLTVTGSINFSRKLFQVGASGGTPFTNSWVNLGGGYAPAAYWKDSNGIVWLEGSVKSGTLGLSAFLLAPGFRPDQNRIFPAFSNNVPGLVQVTSAGQVQPLAVGTASNASYTLDGIAFRTTKT